MPAGFEDFPDLSVAKEENLASDVTTPQPLPPPENFTQRSAEVSNVQDAPLPADPNAPVEGAPAPKPSRFEKRLSKLIGQNHGLREENHQTAAERDFYRERYEQLLRSSQAPPSQQQFSTAPTTYQSEYGPSGHQFMTERGDPMMTPASGQPVPSGNVHDLIRQELQPVLQYFGEAKERDRQRAEFEQIQAQQGASLQAAQEEFPDLMDPGSELYRLTDRVLRENKTLASSPNGPYEATLVARGLLAEDARTGLQGEQLRAAAHSINRPSGSDAGQAPTTGPATEYQQRMSRLGGDKSFEAWNGARRAQRAALGIPEPKPF